MSEIDFDDEQQILALHLAGDKALVSADVEALARIFADDYVQYNESGQAFTRQDVLNNFQTGAIRYPSIVSTGEDNSRVRRHGGSERFGVRRRGSGGKKMQVRYVYLDVLLKRNGEWKLVASQLARPSKE
ncbi:MAG: nuclear transport factor 2 family protein [Acidobacteria bacterium]|nr:nuclear transport factor 2 family protein [Acidobacteriota bacterium]